MSVYLIEVQGMVHDLEMGAVTMELLYDERYRVVVPTMVSGLSYERKVRWVNCIIIFSGYHFILAERQPIIYLHNAIAQVEYSTDCTSS